MVVGLGPHFLLTNIIKRRNFWLQRSKISSKCFVKVILLSKVIPKNSKDKAGSALVAVWDLENIMTFVFSGLVLFFISHTTLPICQGLSADIPLLNGYLYSRPIGRRHLQIATC